MPEPVRVKSPPMYLNSGVLCHTASACVKDLHKSQSKSRHVPADCRHMVWSRCIVDQPRQAEFGLHHGFKFDAELLYAGAMFHDIGLGLCVTNIFSLHGKSSCR
jgi:hypothetical protein